MRHRPPARHLDFHRLLEAIERPGCPVCRLAEEASHHWLRGLFREQVNDVQTRALLRKAGGFCPQHTALALQMGDALGSSILYGDLLTHAPQTMRPDWRLRCPLCEHEARAADNVLATLDTHLREPDVRAAYEASDGICLPHLRLALARSGAAAGDLLLEIELQRLRIIAEECRAFVAKSDYRFTGEIAKTEGNAWSRAARKLGGGYTDVEA